MVYEPGIISNISYLRLAFIDKNAPLGLVDAVNFPLPAYTLLLHIYHQL